MSIKNLFLLQIRRKKNRCGMRNIVKHPPLFELIGGADSN
jgi:hypothetical protein